MNFILKVFFHLKAKTAPASFQQKKTIHRIHCIHSIISRFHYCHLAEATEANEEFPEQNLIAFLCN